MLAPTTALAWELWNRHRNRLLLMGGILLAFSLVYPELCAAVGFNPDSLDATDEVARQFSMRNGSPTLVDVFKALYILFLAGGPVVTLVLMLLGVIWMFTFTEGSPATKDFLTFPARLFLFPMSTSFLFSRLVLGGQVAVMAVCMLWKYCVHMPQMEIFATYQNAFVWMTLLVLGQAFCWALAAWPITRILALAGTLMFFLTLPVRVDLAASPLGLSVLFLLGVVLARAGLQKMRHGQWSGWAWNWPMARWLSCLEWRGPKRFASPAQAQLWFEWRRFTARISGITVVLVVLPVVIIPLCAVAGCGFLPADGLRGLILCLVSMPLLVFGLTGISPTRTDQFFLLIRPLTSGELVLALVKTTAIGATLTWMVVLGVLCVTPWLGDFKSVKLHLDPVWQHYVAFVLAMIFLTWRAAVINLCFVLTGKRWLNQLPGLLLAAGFLSVAMFFILEHDGPEFDWVSHHLVALVASLVVVKLLMAFWAFRADLQRHLLSASNLMGYLVVWALLVGALLATLLVLARPERDLILPACLGVVLLVPLARIGFAPLALAQSRHNLGEAQLCKT